MSFVGLHIHSDYSLLDGASQLPELADRAVELGMPAIALTDHGVMYGAIELIKVCKARKIKPIIGNEMYVVDGSIHEQKRRQKFHQVVLAKNTQGYKNLVKLTTISHLEGFQGRGIFARPCINRELLKQYSEGLIVTSACLGGEIPQAIMAGKLEHARKAARWYKNVFGEDFYLEIQDHGSQEDRIVNVEIVRIAAELDIKIIATNDSHFISCEDVEAHDALLCIQTGKLITEDSRMRYSGTEYLKSAVEMAMLFQDHLPEDVIKTAIANTLEVADKVEPYNVLGEPRIPDFPIPDGHTPATYVEEISRAGLQELLKVNNYADIDAEYQERLDYELKMIEQMGFSTYFLVVWDYIKFARDQGIPVGPGRGSAAGSLVAYTMRITNIDPVHHGLLFERFLNPERKSMPDIDTDFCIERRDEVIQYVTKKYGTERVAQIITFNRMTSKAVLKDVARVLDINYGDSDKMTKFIPTVRGKPTKLAVMISDKTPAPDFKAAYDSNRIFETKTPGAGVPAQQWIDMAMRIEGTNKTFGVHAAGVVISAQPLDEIVPLQRNNDGSVITQYYMEDLDALGLLKMDFLGLRNLTIIQNALDLIKLNQGDDIHPDDITHEERRSISILHKNGTKSKKRPPQVDRTYQAIEAGDLEGVFQLESSGMLDVVSKLKPSCIEDLSSILALYRPGPLDAGLIPHFIDRKHGREEIVYDHPLLEPILEETYGTLCLPKGTLIDRPDGSSTPIEDIRSGDLVLTSNGRQVYSATVAKQWATGQKQLLKIVLSSGTILYSSPDHRFLTAEGDKCAKDLKPVKNLKNAHFTGDTIYEKWPISSESNSLQPNEAYLLGLLIGDGNLVASTPNIACATEECAQWVSTLMSETWGGEAAKFFHTRCWYAYVKFNTQPYRTPLTQFLDRIYTGRDWKVKSKVKHLPSDILSYMEIDRINILRGLWDSDGCYSQRLVYFRSSSPQLLQQVGQLLGSLKIQHHIASNYLCITDLGRFQQLIGETKLPDKNYHYTRDNYLPIHSSELKSCLEPAIAAADYLIRKLAKRALNQATLFKPVHSQYQKNLVGWDQFYQQIYKDTYLQDAHPVYITTIEEAAEDECYDLEMVDQNSPYFLAQGVVVHNCYQEQIMKMAQDLAGYSLGQADLLRRAMSKKKADEMQKQRATFVDGSAKNDISGEIANKLFDQMVLFAEYCFNKSHSTAYAYVTYQTAFLKANYPVEYMAALLTANSGDQDKVTKYLNNCEQTLRIKVEPPDINRSNTNFTPVKGQKSIFFGLSAIKNVGEGAIETILTERAIGGEFKSLADLCQRINLQAVNSRNLESLIKCGAFDNIEPNRQQLIQDMELTVPWAQKRAKEKAIGQGNLFDLMGGTQKSAENSFEAAPKAPLTADFSSQERLQFELELLGVYVSDHPLKSAEHIVRNQKIVTVSLTEIDKHVRKGLIKVVVMLQEIKIAQTKKDNRSMAILKVSGIDGTQVSAVAFVDAYEKVKELLAVNVPIVMEGKVNRRDEELQIVVEGIEIIDLSLIFAEEEIVGDKIAIIHIPIEMLQNQDQLQQLQMILEEYAGTEANTAKIPVYALVESATSKRLVRLGERFALEAGDKAVERMLSLGFTAKIRSQPPELQSVVATPQPTAIEAYP
jgi:DNA polymerase III subunit alpha